MRHGRRDRGRIVDPGMHQGRGGQPLLRRPSYLFIGLPGDRAIPVAWALGVLQEYNFTSLNKRIVQTKLYNKLLLRSYLIIINDPFSNAPPPNHILVLAEGKNNAMVGSAPWPWSPFLWSPLVSGILFLLRLVQCSLYWPDNRRYLEISTLVGSTTYNMKFYK